MFLTSWLNRLSHRSLRRFATTSLRRNRRNRHCDVAGQIQSLEPRTVLTGSVIDLVTFTDPKFSVDQYLLSGDGSTVVYSVTDQQINTSLPEEGAWVVNLNDVVAGSFQPRKLVGGRVGLSSITTNGSRVPVSVIDPVTQVAKGFIFDTSTGNQIAADGPLFRSETPFVERRLSDLRMSADGERFYSVSRSPWGYEVFATPENYEAQPGDEMVFAGGVPTGHILRPHLNPERHLVIYSMPVVADPIQQGLGVSVHYDLEDGSTLNFQSSSLIDMSETNDRFLFKDVLNSEGKSLYVTVLDSTTGTAFEIQDHSFPGRPFLSPNGNQIVYTALDASGNKVVGLQSSFSGTPRIVATSGTVIGTTLTADRIFVTSGAPDRANVTYSVSADNINEVGLPVRSVVSTQGGSGSGSPLANGPRSQKFSHDGRRRVAEHVRMAQVENGTAIFRELVFNVIEDKPYRPDRAFEMVVNTSDDTFDGVADAKHTSLREAIELSNALGNSGGLITFQAPGDLDIRLTNGLFKGGPLITRDRITIDGALPSGKVILRPDPANQFIFESGLIVESSHSEIVGLHFEDFWSVGLLVKGDHNAIVGNSFGELIPNNRGIEVRGSNNHLLDNLIVNSGTNFAQSNVDSYGLWIRGGEKNVVSDNRIGIDASGNPAPNIAGGIVIEPLDGLASDNVIGGINPSDANLIAVNDSRFGVLINSQGTIGGTRSPVSNAVLGNSILGKNAIGLDGQRAVFLPPNDPLDADSGANNRQNFPVLTNLLVGQNQTTIDGTLHSEPTRDYRIEFFENASSGRRAESFLGFELVTTDASGNASFHTTIPKAIGVDHFVTATASIFGFGDTSVVSESIGPPPTVNLSVAPASVLEDGPNNLNFTFTRSGDPAPAISVLFTVGGTATFITDYTPIGNVTSFTGTAGIIDFAANETTKTIVIDPQIDARIEPHETVILTLDTNASYSLGNLTTAVGTITSDDLPVVSVAVTPTSVVENGVQNSVFTFTRSGEANFPLTVNFTVGGTATFDSTFNNDYAISGATAFDATSGSVHFAVGQAQVTVTLDPAGDTTVEPNETVVVTLNAGDTYRLGNPTVATCTITNDDVPAPVPTPPKVTVAVSPASVVENGVQNSVFTFTRSGATTQPLTVNFNVGGTATFNSDYTISGATAFDATTGSVTFAAGQSKATITLDPAGDTVIEPNETAVLTLVVGAGYALGAANAIVATSTIVADETEVSVTATQGTVQEDGTRNLLYTFTRVGAIGTALTANYSVGGTATFKTDYSPKGAGNFRATAGTVVIPANQTTKVVEIDPVVDAAIEGNETVVLTLTPAAAYSVSAGANAATGTITDDDPQVSVKVAPSSVAENGTTNLVYTFTRTGSTANALTANFTVGGSATFNTDYAATGAASFDATTGSVTFAAGQATASVTLDPTGDRAVEENETAILTVIDGDGYFAAPLNTAATGTINNDDAEVIITVSPAVTEDDKPNLVYTFTRTGFVGAALTVNFNVGGTATLTDDFTQKGAATFTPTTGTLAFASGKTTKTITVDPKADTIVELDETMILTLAESPNYLIGDANAATGTILNDDPRVSIIVSPANVTENGTANAVFTFTRSGPTTEPLTANFSVGGTATFNTDYAVTGATTLSESAGTVTFAAGQATANVTIDPTADNAVEANETVILTVTAGDSFVIGAPNIATTTITNDDAEVTVTVSPASVIENGTPNLIYTFTRTGFLSTALTVQFTVGGTATFSTDYAVSGAATFTSTTGTVTFGNGAATKTITINPTGDTLFEANESVLLALTVGLNHSVGINNLATGTITNDD